MEKALLKIMVDTSVLVAAMVESHPAHARALPWLQRLHKRPGDFVVCAHTLAELYAVLTRLPLTPRIGPDTARRLIRDNVESLATVVALNRLDYRQILNELSELGLSGGIVYDALVVQAAKNARVGRLLTLNETDFRRVWPDAGDRIAVP
jgi:predicted nucleic acid-binding protein